MSFLHCTRLPEHWRRNPREERATLLPQGVRIKETSFTDVISRGMGDGGWVSALRILYWSSINTWLRTVNSSLYVTFDWHRCALTYSKIIYDPDFFSSCCSERVKLLLSFDFTIRRPVHWGVATALDLYGYVLLWTRDNCSTNPIVLDLVFRDISTSVILLPFSKIRIHRVPPPKSTLYALV